MISKNLPENDLAKRLVRVFACTTEEATPYGTRYGGNQIRLNEHALYSVLSNVFGDQQRPVTDLFRDHVRVYAIDAAQTVIHYVEDDIFVEYYTDVLDYQRRLLREVVCIDPEGGAISSELWNYLPPFLPRDFARLAWLKAQTVIHEGPTMNLVYEQNGYGTDIDEHFEVMDIRVFLARGSKADGNPFEHTVTIDTRSNDRSDWRTRWTFPAY